MAPVFSSLNLSIIFGNGKMLRGRSSGACLTGRPEPASRACAGELTLWTSGDLKVLHADNAKHQTGEAKQILQWRKEEQELATVLMRSAQSWQSEKILPQDTTSSPPFPVPLKAGSWDMLGRRVELPGVGKTTASVVAIIQQFPQLPLWEAALLSLWFKNLE